MSPPTREIRRAPISLEDAVKRAQNVADSAQAKVKTLSYYLDIIRPQINVGLPSVQPIVEKLESIFRKLENLWEE
jgi:hypothetical protein